MKYLLLIIILLVALLYLFPIICVEGDSMSPTLKSGSKYIGRRIFAKDKCKIGHIYVFNPPHKVEEEGAFVVKRLVDVLYTDKTTWYYFEGDNKEVSFDSRYYGYVDCREVIAELID